MNNYKQVDILVDSINGAPLDKQSGGKFEICTQSNNFMRKYYSRTFAAAVKRVQKLNEPALICRLGVTVARNFRPRPVYSSN